MLLFSIFLIFRLVYLSLICYKLFNISALLYFFKKNMHGILFYYLLLFSKQKRLVIPDE